MSDLSPARRPLVAANWKMHKTTAEARTFLAAFPSQPPFAEVEVVICPPFTALAAVAAELAGSAVGLGAQNLYPASQGAFTGEIAPGMLVDLGCRYAIVGHSERRRLFGETDADVGRKVAAAASAGLRPILCVGETLAQREAGATDLVIGRQLVAAIADLEPGQAEGLVVAYEPVWAIGTGRAASPGDAEAACRHLRRVLEQQCGPQVAVGVRILYGGSVSAGNMAAFAVQPNVDGALVGGASLDPAGFAGIIAAATR